MHLNGALVSIARTSSTHQGGHDQVWNAFGVFETFDPSPKRGVKANWIALDQRMPM